jgi:hypothetical protein
MLGGVASNPGATLGAHSVERTMPTASINWLCAIALLLAQVPAPASSPGDQGITVHVRKERSTFEISFEFTVPATVEETWNVLADYEHMAQFVSTIDSIRIVSRDGNRLEVAQQSHGNVGPIHISVDGLREIELTPPKEIRSHLVKGDLKAADFTTRIVDDGGATRVVGTGKLVPAAWVAWAVTVATVEAQTRRQYQDLRNEILRRKAR